LDHLLGAIPVAKVKIGQFEEQALVTNPELCDPLPKVRLARELKYSVFTRRL
jgi:hypothetical protein